MERNKSILRVCIGILCIGTALFITNNKRLFERQYRQHIQKRIDDINDEKYTGMLISIEFKSKSMLTALLSSNMRLYFVQDSHGYKYYLYFNGTETGIYKTDGRESRRLSQVDFLKSTSETPNDYVIGPRRVKVSLQLIPNPEAINVMINGQFIECVKGVERHSVIHLTAIDLFDIAELSKMKGSLRISGYNGKKQFQFDTAGNTMFWHCVLGYRGYVAGGMFCVGLLFIVLPLLKKKQYQASICFVCAIISLEMVFRFIAPHNRFLSIDAMMHNYAFNLETMTDLFEPGKYNAQRLEQPKWRESATQRPLRILCLGSSPIQDLFGEPFPHMLESKMNSNKEMLTRAGFDSCAVLNAGIVVSTFFEQFIYFSRVLVYLKPDVVILYIRLDVSADEVARYARIRKIMSLYGSWIRTRRLLYAALEFRDPKKAVVYAYDWLRNSYVFMGLEYVRKRAMFREEQQISKRLSCAVLEKFAAACAYADTKLILIPQVIAPVALNRGAVFSYARQLAKKEPHVSLIDISLRFSREDETRVFFPNDQSHLTLEGHEIITEAIFNKLMEEIIVVEKS